MKSFLLLVALTTWQPHALIVPLNGHDVKSPDVFNIIEPIAVLDYHTELRAKQLHPRAARKKCVAPRYPGASSKRSIDIQGKSALNQTLWRRMRLPEGDDIEEYIMQETGEAESTVWGRDTKNADGVPETVDINTSVWTKFVDERAEFSWEAEELKGCTMLVITSRTGVFIGHYWENISFDTDSEYTNLWKNGKNSQDDIFKETVIKGLRTGTRHNKISFQASLTSFAKGLDDDHIRAFLIHPSTAADETPGSPQNVGYRPQWDQMRDLVYELLPKVKERDSWREVPYDVEEDFQVLETTSRGRVLFKYDPAHGNGNGVNVQLAMLWSEKLQLLRDEWQ